jgi:hypothetical protein
VAGYAAVVLFWTGIGTMTSAVLLGIVLLMIAVIAHDDRTKLRPWSFGK